MILYEVWGCTMLSEFSNVSLCYELKGYDLCSTVSTPSRNLSMK